VLAEHVSGAAGDAVNCSTISKKLHTEMPVADVARPNGVWATPDELMKVPADFYAAAGIAPGDVIKRTPRDCRGTIW